MQRTVWTILVLIVVAAAAVSFGWSMAACVICQLIGAMYLRGDILRYRRFVSGNVNFVDLMFITGIRSVAELFDEFGRPDEEGMFHLTHPFRVSGLWTSRAMTWLPLIVLIAALLGELAYVGKNVWTHFVMVGVATLFTVAVLWPWLRLGISVAVETHKAKQYLSTFSDDASDEDKTPTC